MTDLPNQITIPASLATYQISPTAYITQHEDKITHLVAGAIVFHNSRILLIQRSRQEIYEPLKWEVPGGSCEPTDETIIASAVRELWEEAGLIATAMIDVVEDGHDWVDEWGGWRKITFVFEVEKTRGVAKGGLEEVEEAPEVKLDPTEHGDFTWVTEEEVKEGRKGWRVFSWISEEQKQTILDAFELLREGRRVMKAS
ncbi:NUDIX hydrolase domain-like protein [Pseudomassariella vexata]|uniref:NUDIX hydrolase domain-like protein n=1 Tax=Pseudomassariella vexata TaxID=1141098 RepID=A0A1Y2DLB7_9PEZI|nr:NUDIX hydrolase domain-like protein [Pseudomassariella vexata]ORY60053.1 NUDIX hydrolase domain-like protein [Pseudomassariella vexata]